MTTVRIIGPGRAGTRPGGGLSTTGPVDPGNPPAVWQPCWHGGPDG